MKRHRKLILVSNRLPFTVKERNGAFRYTQSVGGLTTGMSAFLQSSGAGSPLFDDYVWVGWPGSTIGKNSQAALRKEVLERFKSHPVFLTVQEMELFYLGFCNETIWPLFHYFPSLTTYREDFWNQYRKVNETFAEAVAEIAGPDDIIWVHDYQLMLTPGLLKKKIPQVPVGFFLHIPFPSFEIFRLIPGAWRREILQGLMGADLVGFHTYEYTENYLRCVLRILGEAHTMGNIQMHDRLVKAETFPMGIDVERFTRAAESPDIRAESRQLRDSLSVEKIILSVDRLDYTKGILNRLEAYEHLLESRKEHRRAVVLVMIVVPSRTGVRQYGRMKKQIEETVGRINGRFGTVGWSPIIYQYRAVPFPSLVAYYAASDIALVTPLRDGMNLIAKEYIASRVDGAGVLILSEMAGAAKELGEALVINPNYKDEIAAAMQEALTMPKEEQQRRNRVMRERITRYNVVRWANDFVGQLQSIRGLQQALSVKMLSSHARTGLLEHYARAQRRGIYLDYDGTLSPFVRRPEDAVPSQSVIKTLKTLADNESTMVTIISGRKRDLLEEWFKGIPVRLVAEHGVWVKEPEQEWTLMKPLNTVWKESVMPILEQHADRLPGSFVEEKEYSVVWHFRGADPEHGELMAAELMDTLIVFTANVEAQVLRGNKIVEVRSLGVTKGIVGEELIRRANHDFVLFIGDDWTDEDLFRVLSTTAYSIKVGMAKTHARWMVQGVEDVHALLAILAANS